MQTYVRFATASFKFSIYTRKILPTDLKTYVNEILIKENFFQDVEQLIIPQRVEDALFI